MPLDLGKISAQIDGMAADLTELSQRRADQVDNAVVMMREQGGQFDRLKAKIEQSKGKTTWLVAGLKEGLHTPRLAPAPLSDYVAMGVDGSQIGVDRHSPIQCCLINVGTCLLRYGTCPDAVLESKPILFYRDEDLFIDSPTDSSVRQPLEGPVFSAKREIVAVQHLVELVKSHEIDAPCLILLDASLILWPLAGKNIPDFVRDRLLGEEFLRCLDELKGLSASKGIALASYVSSPRSTDVTNALRIGICPHQPTNCNEYCPPAKGKQCGQVDGVRDRDLFAHILPEGQRSEIFASLSSIVQGHYREHEVHFFYVNVGSEIARVEVPGWVAADELLLDLAHSLILDQVRRGQGYPVALTEAHERAVVTVADRENFWLLVEAELDHRYLPGRASEKSQSKNIRGL